MGVNMGGVVSMKMKFAILAFIFLLMPFSLGSSAIINHNITTLHVKTIWNVTQNSPSINITPVGNIFGTNTVNFLIVNNSKSTEISVVEGDNGVVKWEINVNPIFEYTVVNLSNSQGLVVLYRNGTLAMYNLANGNPIWMHNEGTYYRMGYIIAPYNGGDIIFNAGANPYSKAIGFTLYIEAINLTGSTLWSTHFLYGMNFTYSYEMFYPLPPYPSYSGAVLLNTYSYSGGDLVPYAQLVNAYTGNVIWNVSVQNGGGINSATIGNFLGKGPMIAYSTNAISGSLVIANLSNGNALQYYNASQPLWICEQQNAISMEVYDHLMPSLWYANMPSSSLSEDLILEGIGSIGMNGTQPMRLMEYDFVSSTTVWNVILQTNNSNAMMNPAPYYFITLPNNQGSYVIAYSSYSNKVYSIVNGYIKMDYKMNVPNSYLENMLINPNIFYTNEPVIADARPGAGYYTVSYIDLLNGSLILSKNVNVPQSFSKVYVEPLSLIANQTTPSFALIGDYKNGSESYTYIEGLNGINATTIFAMNFQGYFIMTNGTYMYNSIYPGLNNGQLMKGTGISNIILTTTNGITAFYSYYVYIAPIKINSFSVTPINGMAPLNVTYQVNVTGGVKPYVYKWYINGFYYTSNVSYYNFSYQLAGSYNASVTVYDSMNSYATSNNITVTVYSPSNGGQGAGKKYYTVSGIVQSSNYSPISNATLRFSSGNITETGSNGFFSLNLTNGTWSVIISKNGYQTAYYNITVNGSPLTETFTMYPERAGNTTSTTLTSQGSFVYLIIAAVVIVAVISLVIWIRRKK
ncbi:MAG: carboxypeptidase regulatory-like domain-containing protein [Thermoplasmata archaeon]